MMALYIIHFTALLITPKMNPIAAITPITSSTLVKVEFDDAASSSPSGILS